MTPTRWQTIIAIIAGSLTICSVAIAGTFKLVNLIVESRVGRMEQKLDDVVYRLGRMDQKLDDLDGKR